MKLTRRKALTALPVVAGAGIAAPAIAQNAPAIKWRLTSSFPKNIDIMWGTSASICRFVSEMTEGRFVIEPFAAGELVPPFQVLDAVAARTVEIGHTPALFNHGKDPTFALCSVVPFADPEDQVIHLDRRDRRAVGSDDLQRVAVDSAAGVFGDRGFFHSEPIQRDPNCPQQHV